MLWPQVPPPAQEPVIENGVNPGICCPRTLVQGTVQAVVIWDAGQPWGGGVAVKQPLQTVQPRRQGSAPQRDGRRLTAAAGKPVPGPSWCVCRHPVQTPLPGYQGWNVLPLALVPRKELELRPRSQGFSPTFRVATRVAWTMTAPCPRAPFFLEQYSALTNSSSLCLWFTPWELPSPFSCCNPKKPQVPVAPL